LFQLSAEETAGLRSQIATSKVGRGGRRYAPYVFTEHGAIMLANVLSTPRAAEVSIYVVRAFVRLRQMITTNAEVAAKLAALERQVAGHDAAIASLVRAIRRLMATPSAQTSRTPPYERRRIGFAVEEGRPGYRRPRKR
jgi:hypothetical protein